MRVFPFRTAQARVSKRAVDARRSRDLAIGTLHIISSECISNAYSTALDLQHQGLP